MDVSIREVEESDVNDIQELNMASWLEAYDGIIPEEKMRSNINYPVDRLRKKKSDNKLIFLVAEVENKVVGTINFCWSENNTHEFIKTEENQAQLRSVYLHPDYWGNGVGTKLFKNGLEELPDKINEVKVESLKDNDIGTGFYSKQGFKKIEESKVELFGDKYNSVIQRMEIE